MTLCSIDNCKEKYHAKGLCIKHYQKTDKYKQYKKQYQKTDKYKQYQKQYKKTDKYKQYQKQYQKQYHKQYQKTDKYKQYHKQYLKQKAINDLIKEVNKYDWIKDKKAMILDGKLADKRMRELRNPKEAG